MLTKDVLETRGLQLRALLEERRVVPHKIDHIVMTIAQWHEVPDNPRQRDTEGRLKRARHLLERSPTHQKVAMAQCVDGRQWKLDGHTRDLLWYKYHPDLAPQFVDVDVYWVDDEEEAKGLYECYDNRLAVKTPIDEVQGAFRELEFSPRSKMVRSGQIGNAVKFADNFYNGAATGRFAKPANTYEVITEWLPEITLVDECQPTRKMMVGPFVTAALLAFRKYQKNRQKVTRISEFWEKFNAGQGSSTDGEMDAVQALLSLRDKTRHQTSHGSQQYDLCAKAISAIERWLLGETYKPGSGIKKTNLLMYCVKK